MGPLSTERPSGTSLSLNERRKPLVSQSTREQVADVLRILFSQPSWYSYGSGQDVVNDLFFVQERQGHLGKPFPIVKIRSMQKGTHHLHRELIHTNGLDEVGHVPNDPRMTGLGRFLRATKLDELPQGVQYLTSLVSNFRGRHFALFGIRPSHDFVAQGYSTDEIQDLMDVRPGLIGVTYALPPSSHPEKRKPFNVAYNRRCKEVGQLRTNIEYAPSVLFGLARRALHKLSSIAVPSAKKAAVVDLEGSQVIDKN